MCRGFLMLSVSCASALKNVWLILHDNPSSMHAIALGVRMPRRMTLRGLETLLDLTTVFKMPILA